MALDRFSTYLFVKASITSTFIYFTSYLAKFIFLVSNTIKFLESLENYRDQLLGIEVS